MALLIYNMFAVWLVCVVSMAVAGECPHACTCKFESAYCYTNDTDPFPQNLDSNTRDLFVSYKGSRGLILASSMISHYPYLEKLTISGNLTSIREEAFSHSQRLLYLAIQHSQLQEIKNNTFGNTHKLNVLVLNDNHQMRHLPFDVFPSLEHLETLDLSYNNFPLCVGKRSIGDAFWNLKQLATLNLAGLGHEEECKEINSSFFEPIQQVTHLNLSESGFLLGDLSVLKPLTKLEALSLNNVEPFNECPSKAEALFENLSRTLKHIEAKRWRSKVPFGDKCLFSSETFAGLGNMTRLYVLDFEYSDRPFGNVLRQGLFRHLSHIRILQLAWCRLAQIEDGALEDLHPQDLYLQHNPIGEQEFWVSGRNRSMTSIEVLDLEGCSIDTDASIKYDMSFALNSFPKLFNLSLARNLLVDLPTFSTYNSTSAVRIFDLFSNKLRTVSHSGMSEVCRVMPELKYIDLSDNELTTIELLCPSLEEVVLVENLMDLSQINYKSIKQLQQLRHLNMNRNRITTLPPDIFHLMSHLNTLHLIDNQITSLDVDQFLYNSHLDWLGLALNSLESFDPNLLRNNSRMYTLYLHGNKITSFSKDFVASMESKQNLTRIRLERNPFDCSCGQMYFQSWVRTTKRLENKDELECLQPDSLRGQSISQYDDPIFECYVKWGLVGVAGTVGLILVIMVTYRLRWYLSHIRYVALSVSDRLRDLKQQDECKYDAMVVFNSKSNEDTNWVKELMIQLEGGDYPQPINLQSPDGRENKIYIRVRDDITGGITFDQCCEVMRQSRKIILVISNSFLQEPECISEAAFAGNELFSTATFKPERILVLVLEELQEPLTNPLSSLLIETIYIDLYESTRNDERKMKAVWQKLKKYVSHKKPSSSLNAERNDGYQPLP